MIFWLFVFFHTAKLKEHDERLRQSVLCNLRPPFFRMILLDFFGAFCGSQSTANFSTGRLCACDRNNLLNPEPYNRRSPWFMTIRYTGSGVIGSHYKFRSTGYRKFTKAPEHLKLLIQWWLYCYEYIYFCEGWRSA